MPLGTRTETKNVNSLRSVERAVRYEITRHAAILAGGGSILQETRHWHEDTGVTTSGRAEVRRRRLPLLPRARPRARRARPARGSRSCAPPCPSRRRSVAGACRPTGATPISRCATSSTPARSSSSRPPSRPAPPRPAPASGGPASSPGAPTSRAATSADFGVTPAHVAELDAMVSDGRLNDSMARQVLDGVLAGEGTPSRWPTPAACELVSDDGALADGGRRGHRGQPRRRGQDPRRQGPGGRRAHRPGHEADEGPGRRGQGARAHPRPARRRRLTRRRARGVTRPGRRRPARRPPQRPRAVRAAGPSADRRRQDDDPVVVRGGLPAEGVAGDRPTAGRPAPATTVRSRPYRPVEQLARGAGAAAR